MHLLILMHTCICKKKKKKNVHTSLWSFSILCFLAKANATEFITALKYFTPRMCYIHIPTEHFTTQALHVRLTDVDTGLRDGGCLSWKVRKIVR